MPRGRGRALRLPAVRRRRAGRARPAQRRAVPGRARARRPRHRARPRACRRPRSTPTSSSSSSSRRCSTPRRSPSAPPSCKANAKPIGLLAVGLVLVTIGAVAAVANAVHGHPVGGRVRARRGARARPTPSRPPRCSTGSASRAAAKTILQGESLVNDATGLTAYRLALGAVGGTAGSVVEIGFEFVWVAAGGDRDRARGRLGVRPPAADRHGPVAGRRALGAHARSSPTSPPRSCTCRACSRRSRPASTSAAARSTSSSPATRLRTLAFWESTAFLLDGLLFVIIGAPGPDDHRAHRGRRRGRRSACYALLITAVVMGTRALWMLVVPDVLHSETTVPERIVIAWSGMRGGVSLAAALAITVDGFPQPRPRDLRRLRRDRAHARPSRAHALDARQTARAAGERGAPARVGRSARCGSPKPRSNGSRSSKATRPSTSSSGCATATAHGWSGSRRAWRATRTRAARPTWPRRAS